MKFQELGLPEFLCENLALAGFIKPTPIQESAIPIVLNFQDIIGLAQTGTGKTAAFLLPILAIQSQRFQKHRKPSVLVLVPTRELASQVMENLKKFDPNNFLKPVMLIGGDPMGMQERNLKKPYNILVATPGRFLDFLEKGKIILHGIQHVVIDEADRMLDMGFIPEVDRILEKLPNNKQTLLFSATITKDIEDLVKKYMILPKTISIKGVNESKASIDQKVIMVDSKDKRIALRSILNNHKDLNCVIFCNQKKDIDILEGSLLRHEFSAAALHSGIGQEKRNQTLQNFKDGKTKILIASDVLARGIDIQALGMVINFTVPYQPEDYIHRIGRTGRADLKGIAYTLVDKKEIKLLKNIEEKINSKIAVEEVTIETKKEEKIKTEAKPIINRQLEKVVGFGNSAPAFILRSAYKN